MRTTLRIFSYLKPYWRRMIVVYVALLIGVAGQTAIPLVIGEAKTPVRPAYIARRRTSPDPRRNPAALEKVGAAVTAVAANAPKRARRLKPLELDIVIVPKRPSFLPTRSVQRGCSPLVPRR